VLLADSDLNQADKSAERVNQLLGQQVVFPTWLDVTDQRATRKLFAEVDAVLSAVPFRYNLALTRAAIDAGVHLCDMGGHTPTVKEQFGLDENARAAGISVIPDCGMGPGLINTMGAYAIQMLDDPEGIFIYDAGLPLDPIPPWNYVLTFHINGLTNEMDGQAVFLRNGEITLVDTLSEPEMLEIPGLGVFEADVTSGGTSTAPWSFHGVVRNYENKVFRYPGHYEWLRAYKTLGLFQQDPITVDGQQIVPRQIYHHLLEPKISSPDPRDIGVIYVRGVGRQAGKPVEVQIQMIDRYDPQTGFTAMERLTAWHCTIILILQTTGKIPAGVHAHEITIDPHSVLQEFDQRGIPHSVRWQDLS
jgi:lysine 6-dehydrogenase